jgi:hypothetical protein
MQKDGDEALKGTKLGMGKLYKHILKTDLPSIHFLAHLFIMTMTIILFSPTDAHRALGDVQAMKAVLTHPSLLGCLSNLQLHSPSQQLKSWTKQKILHQKYTSLTTSLGKPAITAPQAKKLVSFMPD